MRRLPRPLRLIPVALTWCALWACPDRTPNRPSSTFTEITPERADVATHEVADARDDAPADAVDRASDADSGDTGPTTEVLAGANLIDVARILYRDAACGGTGPALPPFPTAVVERHCASLEPVVRNHREQWIEPVGQYIASLRPNGLPPEVVYPFGGGDLTSALTTYPDALVYTMISLEPTGDVRAITRADEVRLDRSLRLMRDHVKRQFAKAHSRTDNLALESRSVIPGEAAFNLVALAAHGFEPVSLRYFRIEPSGSLHYFDEAELGPAVLPPAPPLAQPAPSASASTSARPSRTPPPSPNFANIELRFRKLGDVNAPVKTFRHVAWNLDDAHFPASPLAVHLTAKGKVATMTKAASHLLWDDHFSQVRDYLLANMVIMFSDTTCPPPRLAQAAGFVQDTYGRYDGAEPFGTVKAKDVQAFRALFKTNPARDLPFRYGYPDNAGHGHMVVTRRP